VVQARILLGSGHPAGQSEFQGLSMPINDIRDGELPMKVYQVVRRNGTWHVHMPDASAEAPSSQDKSKVVAWICEVAKEHDAEVQVRDVGGQIETIYRYVGGVEERRSRDELHTRNSSYHSEAPVRHRPLLRRLLNV
jgi:hypothetical protein